MKLKMNNNRLAFRLLLLLPALVVGSGLEAAEATKQPRRPNILWITSEDMSSNLGSFGDLYARTPNLDRLAARGIRYTNVFSPAPVCAPSRSSLILGTAATGFGSQHMRSKIALPPATKLFSRLVRDAGYFATNNAKEDYNFDRTPQGTWDRPGGAANPAGRHETARLSEMILIVGECPQGVRGCSNTPVSAASFSHVSRFQWRSLVQVM